MKFIDYRGLDIKLNEQVWTEHIQKYHSELTLEIILKTLIEPDEVWISQKRDDTVLYYLRKEILEQEKIRYWVIVVKKILNENLISTAMTKSTIVGMTCVYKRK